MLAALAMGCGGKSEVVSDPGTTTPASPDTSGEQSFAAAMRVMCDAPKECCADLEPSQKATALASWIDERVTNADAKKLFQDLGAVEPAQKMTMVKDAVKTASIEESDCAFLELWAAPAP